MIPNLLITDTISGTSLITIGIDNNSLVINSDNMGCFSGDCLCCAEDGSSNPIANIVWDGTKFVYYTDKASIATLQKTLYQLPMNPEEFDREIFEHDISGEINVSSDEVWNSNIYDIHGYKYTLTASNKCGFSTIDAYCYWPICFANYSIDCPSGKIRLRSTVISIDGNFNNSEILDEYYDLGNVPDLYRVVDNNCGKNCVIDVKPECIFNKNSIIYNFSDFKDIEYEATEYYSLGKSYSYMKYTGLSTFNRSFVLPLYIDCGSVGSIRYNVPDNIPVGSGTLEVINTVWTINEITGDYQIWSNERVIYDLEYLFFFLTPRYKVTGYTLFNNMGSTYHTCGDFDDQYCRTVDIGFWKYKYISEPYTTSILPIICEKTRIAKLGFVGTSQENLGTLTTYYDNL